MPFAIASIIVHRRSGIGSFDDNAVANPQAQALALAQRVDLKEEPAFSARFPAEQPVEMRITMKDGTVYSGKCVVTKGEPSKPHQPEELTGKFFELGVPVWGKPVTQKLYDGLMQLERIPDFRAFADDFTL